MMKKAREWLKDMRLTQKLTMKEVAREAGISESYYCVIESGERNCSVDTAKKIAAVLGFEWVKFFE